MKIAALALLGAAVLFVLWAMLKTRRPLSALFLSAVSGNAALFAVELLGGVLPIDMPLSWASVGAAAIFGVPGVCAMLLLNAFVGGA
ncbi:MAG: pro-sigmaK processing inhibitor BofA family protein [Clostridium sp.]|jgi:pro-sigmaK processing inhibitor BofA|nr:pro-sigmaK processing inhibitor BofA family protein [Clostridium sp.]